MNKTITMREIGLLLSNRKDNLKNSKKQGQRLEKS